ncbi:MAG: N-acetylmuramoyl-L-alanine amidase [Eubacterium sp.]|nr:N-acetylmuramoyl-L-alanine amidase [Eubacterium sp.]
MSAEAYRQEEMYMEDEPDVIGIKRNPYLVDYEHQKRLRGYDGQRAPRGGGGQRSFQRTQKKPQGGQEIQREREMERAPRRMVQRSREMERASQRTVQRNQGMRRASQRTPQQNREADMVSRRMSQRELEIRRISKSEQERNRRAAIEKKRAVLRRRRIVRMQRMALMAGIFSITLLCGILYLKRMDAKAVEPEHEDQQVKITDGILPAATSLGMVQGLSATEFAKHPEWEENFLTPNEYSRPGEALEEINSIFVHYTANPNTSAAQNRSYFEQLKDTHITSASAHFIIGYNGEIIQCIPLDEIAYAVQTRNYDSVSIECCYKSADGSFTQETYDSLIGLLAWLTDAYDLTTDDILRHYDCGGKKCPIYYTEHEDAWAKLKSDVAEKL